MDFISNNQDLLEHLNSQTPDQTIEFRGRLTLTGEPPLVQFGGPTHSQLSYTGELKITKKHSEEYCGDTYEVSGRVMLGEITPDGSIRDSTTPEFSSTLRGGEPWKLIDGKLETKVDNLSLPYLSPGLRRTLLQLEVAHLSGIIYAKTIAPLHFGS